MTKTKNKKKSVKKKTNTIKKRNNNTSKVIITGAIVLVVIAVFSVILKENDGHILKSEYQMGEVGYIDDIEITLKSANYINTETGIEVTFEITNKTSNTITITPDDYFKFYDVNKVQIPNKYTNDKNIVKKNETINYKLQYDVTKKELYEIYFYSGVVENNIKFSFKSSDITDNILDEKNIVTDEE